MGIEKKIPGKDKTCNTSGDCEFLSEKQTCDLLKYQDQRNGKIEWNVDHVDELISNVVNGANIYSNGTGSVDIDETTSEGKKDIYSAFINVKDIEEDENEPIKDKLKKAKCFGKTEIIFIP